MAYLCFNGNDRYLCVYVNTTGNNVKSEYILEVSWVLMERNVKVDEDHMIFYHDNFWKTKNIHRIPYQEIKQKHEFESNHPQVTVFKSKLSKLLLECVTGKANLVAQNSKFERKWLSEKLNLDLEEIKVFDLSLVEQILSGESKNLSHKKLNNIWEEFLRQKKEILYREININKYSHRL